MILEASFNNLKKYLKKEITFEELSEILFQLKIEVEKQFVEEEEVIKESEEETIKDKIVFEITQDRPDLLSLPGIANLINNFKWNKKPKIDYPVKKDEGKEYKIKVGENVKEIRPYIAGAVVKNIIISDTVLREIMNFQENIHKTFARDRSKASIGLYRFELLKFPLHYEAKDPIEINFEPLGFDRVMTAEMILKEHPTGIKYAHLLKPYNKYPLFYDDSKQVLSLPPIINSNFLGKLEPDDEIPQNVFIEVTGWDEYIVQKCLAIIVMDLLFRGGETYEVSVEYPNGKIIKSPILEPIAMKVSLKNLYNYFGEKLSIQKIEKLLNKVGYLIDSKNEDEIIVKTLPNRYDLMHEVDVIEDIIIAYGLQNLKPEIPKLLTKANQHPSTQLKNTFRRIFANLGYVEVLNYMLTDENILSKNIKNENANYFKLKNYKLEQFNVIRNDLIPILLEYLRYNLNNPYPQKIFEIGSVIRPNPRNYNCCEELLHIAGVVSDSRVNINNIKNEMDLLSKLLSVNFKYIECNNKICFEGRSFKIMVNERELGYFGEIHPEILLNFNLKMPTIVFELELAQLFPEFKSFI